MAVSVVVEDVLESIFDEEVLRMLMDVQEMVCNHPDKPFTEQDLLYLLTLTAPEDKYYNAHMQRMHDKNCKSISREKYNDMWSITGRYVFKQMTEKSILDQIFKQEKVDG